MRYIHIMGYHSFIKKEQNLAIYSNMGRLERNYPKGNSCDRERETLYDITYMWNLKKYNKPVSITKRCRLSVQRTNQWLPIRRRRGGETQWLGEKEEQIIGYKVGYEDVLYNTGDIANILYIYLP